MKYNYLITLLFLSLSLGVLFTACGSDDAEDCATWTLSVQDELDAVTSAVTAYSADPTNTALCEAYVDSLNDYINALDNSTVESCARAAGEVAEWQASIDDSRASIAGIMCP